MKKLSIVLMMLVVVIGLASCMKEEDYYTKNEIDQQLAELQPTQLGRYLESILEGIVFDGGIQFVNVGDTVRGEVDAWQVGQVVIEVDTAITIDLELTVVAEDGGWDVNIYYPGNFLEPDLTFENVENGDVFRITLQAGFNTIEFDSYADVLQRYTIKIIEGE